ncbi:MAG TPA: glycoside hydrolase family 38 C-terminal domain-containing protein [Bryobacteraceae bacterium]|nr:glycoside hydrolase family 38 C-terminal domain-containing protein [Bryobacteraceae bacterium]
MLPTIGPARLRGAALSLRLLFLLALVAPAVAQDSASWPAEAHSYRFHMIGQAHIDPVWLWPWSEGLSEVHSTFRAALDRMKETPDFRFTASSAQFYEWVAENDPAMLAEIRERVREGRWGAVGGWWVEPDINVPNGESLVRQGLYGQLTFRRLLGRFATVAYNPDSFGHTGALPQILTGQGMHEYVFMRPQAHEKSLPGTLFWWQAPDGTRVLTYRIPVSYNDEGTIDGRLRQILRETNSNVKSVMAFYGAGDHGGGATKANIRSIDALRDQPGAPAVVYSTPEQYFAEMRRASTENLPVVTGDLQHHSVGCYTAESWMKKTNRATEMALLAAEKLASIGSLVWGANYPGADLADAWKRVLFLQFHDSMAGTALPEHYEIAAPEGYGFARQIADRALYMAAQKLAWQVPAEDPESVYLVAFNLHPWPVTANFEYDVVRRSAAPSRLEDEQGRAVPHQWAPATTEVNGRARLIVRAELPAFGYRQFRLRQAAAAAPASDLQINGHVIENAFLRVTFAPDGGIGIFDKRAGREVFQGGARGAQALVMDDPSDTWSHDVRAYDKQIGAFAGTEIAVVEAGPLRADVRVRSRYGASTLTTDWLLYAGSPAVEARVTLDWHEHSKMLKLSFPVDVPEPHATYEIAYGNIVRPPNGDEEPGQRWIDMSGGGDYGLAVVNDAKYGYSALANDMRISIVRGAPFAHHIPHKLDPAADHIWQDQGVQTFRLLLVPHRGAWQDAGIQRAAEEFTTPVPVVYQGIHRGSRPQAASFLSVSAPDIVITAIKKAEESNDLIVRCYETAGHAGTASIGFDFAGKRWSGTFRAYEIKTLRMDARTGAIREVNLLEE